MLVIAHIVHTRARREGARIPPRCDGDDARCVGELRLGRYCGRVRDPSGRRGARAPVRAQGVSKRELRPGAMRRGAPGGGAHGGRATDLAGLGPSTADLLKLRFASSSHLGLMRTRADLLLPQADAVGRGAPCGCGRKLRAVVMGGSNGGVVTSGSARWRTGEHCQPLSRGLLCAPMGIGTGGEDLGVPSPQNRCPSKGLAGVYFSLSLYVLSWGLSRGLLELL
jgi:hypothetical protein